MAETAASPLSSTKHCGLPWELGVAEAQQTLVMNNLRDRVVLRTDGGFRNGRDVVIGAMLGAEQFNFGTIAMIAMAVFMCASATSTTAPWAWPPPIPNGAPNSKELLNT